MSPRHCAGWRAVYRLRTTKEIWGFPALKAGRGCLMKKALWQLLPILIAAYILTFLMQTSFTSAYFRFGKDAGISSAELGRIYAAAPVSLLAPWPAVFLQLRVGARASIGFLMLLAAAASIVTVLTLKDALPGSPHLVYASFGTFFALRAAILAGGILLISQWFTACYRGRALGLLIAGTVLAGVIDALFDHLTDGVLKGAQGLESWQWAMATLGMASALIGLSSLITLADRPVSADWMDPDHAQALEEKLEQERIIRKAPRDYSALQRITQSLFVPSWLLDLIITPPAKQYFSKFARLFTLAIVFACLSAGAGLLRFLATWTTILGETGRKFGLYLPQTAAIFLTVTPSVSAIAIVAWTWHSDEKRERIWHVAGPALFAGILALALLQPDPVLTGLVLLLSAAAASLASAAIWALPFAFLQGAAAAAAIALMSSAAGIGSMVGAYVFGQLGGGLYVTRGHIVASAALFIFSGIIVLCLGNDPGAKTSAGKLRSE
jgi:MFS transporter, ACS family, tartrate transporter